VEPHITSSCLVMCKGEVYVYFFFVLFIGGFCGNCPKETIVRNILSSQYVYIFILVCQHLFFDFVALNREFYGMPRQYLEVYEAYGMMGMNPDQFLLKIYIGTSKDEKMLQAICEENTQHTTSVSFLVV